MKNILFLTVFFCSLSVYAGGGTIVGNGAGAVESSFQQVYKSLEKIIPNCVGVLKCQLADDEKELLSSELSIVIHNENKKDRLVFLSEKLNPGFFTTGTSEPFRIAKTFLNPDSSIYVNIDMLYKEDGQPAVHFQDIVRILVHELGHQAGVEDHALLDILGSKVAAFSEENTSYYRYKVEAGSSDITFAVTNFEFPGKNTLFIFNWNNEIILDLTDSITSNATCAYPSEVYSGIEVTNGHFNFDYNGLLSFQAWANISCYDSISSQVNVYRKNLNIDLDSEFKLKSLSIK
jgi:hypothetical protein